ncbi:MAG: CYTH domain-containing protein [Bacteroidales bacterium]|nr:CYTH domain-containing protein [Bacteroidales bacterium]
MNNTEIERKFLVSGDFRPYVTASSHILQGYLARQNGRTVRVRLRDDKGYLTIKGPTDGISRFEWEREISREDALALAGLCQGGFIDKTRHLVPFGGHVFEVDEFHGANAGLILAEVELSAADESFARPAWLGEEVSGDARYYNSHLLVEPYNTWK